MKKIGIYLFAAVVLVSCGGTTNNSTVLGTMSAKGQTYTFYSSDTASCNLSTNGRSLTDGTGTLSSATISFRNSAGAGLNLTVASSQPFGSNYVVSENIAQGSNGDTIAFTVPSGSTYSTALGSTAGTNGCTYNLSIGSSSYSTVQLNVTCTNVSGTAGDQASMVANLNCPSSN